MSKSLGRMGLALTLASSSVASQSAGIGASSPTQAVIPAAPYDAVLDGMVCKQQKSGRMDCEYRVGRAMRFMVAGVGQEDVVVSFMQADSSAEYAASFVPLHGCVVVKPARPADGTRALQIYSADSVATFAFVSPKTGRVYRSWAACLSATRPDTRVEAKAYSTPDAARATATKTGPPATKVATPDTAKRVTPPKPPAR